MGRRGDAGLVADSHDRAAQPGQLERPTPLEIVEHRRPGLRRKRLKGRHHIVEHLSGQRDALRVRDRQALHGRSLTHRDQIGIVAQRTDWQARHGRHPAEGRQHDELPPDVALDVLAQGRLESRGQTRVVQLGETRGWAAIQLAEDQPIERRVANDAGLRNDRVHVRRPAGRV